ncbi:MAG: lipase family protein [Rickettsiales bacterium]|jgi:hypothetical protein|nr:lipase family protein [Rickettsiales bacterium]
MPETNIDTKFSLEEVQTAALFSELAYHEQDSKEFQEVFKEAEKYGGIEKVVSFRKDNNKELAGHVIRTADKQLITAYRGTDNIDEVISDLDVPHKAIHFKNGFTGYAHGGFLSEFYSSNENRKKAQKEASGGQECSKKSVGHSLGGALATISKCIDTEENPSIESKTLTFGAPLCFSHETADYLLKNTKIFDHTLNIQQKYDPVPLALKPLDYISVGHVVTLPTEHLNSHGLQAGYDHNYYESSIQQGLKNLKPVTSVPEYSAAGYTAAVTTNAATLALALKKRNMKTAMSLAFPVIAAVRGVFIDSTKTHLAPKKPTSKITHHH